MNLIKKIAQGFENRKAEKQAESEKQLRLEEEKRQEQLMLEQQRQEQAKLEQEKRFKEAEEKQKREKERLLSCDDILPRMYIIGLSINKTETHNGLTYTYKHIDYFLTEVESWQYWGYYDKKIKLKQLTGENIGAEYIAQNVFFAGEDIKYKVWDYKGNVRTMQYDGHPCGADTLKSLNSTAGYLNRKWSEDAYEKRKAMETKNKLFGE